MQIVGRKKTGNQTRISLADFPKPSLAAIGHETERRVILALGDFGDVVTKLFIGFARTAAGAFGFNHGEHVPRVIIKTVIGDAIPRFSVIAVHGNFEVRKVECGLRIES